MRTVTVDQTEVRRAADAQGRAADHVRGQADAENADTGALAPVFGLIGAGFLAALVDVQAQRSAALTALADVHRSTSAATEAACCAYTCCDADAAREVSA